MKTILFFLIFASNILYAISINDSLLNIHSTLVPKIPFMDYKFKDKLENNSIHIVIFYDKINYKSAKLLKEKIDTKYKNGIKGHPVETKLVTYENLQNIKANIYYLFPSKKKNIINVLKYAKRNNVITFSYLKESLNIGCMISLNIGTKVRPIINLNAIKSGNISLRPILLDISEICNCGII